jgi:O-antigen/teichoic acid export membrane protein
MQEVPKDAGRAGVAVLSPPDLRTWWSRLAGRGFAANVAFMVSGTALGQAASVMLAPVLTRLYTPEQFGYLSVYTAALTILGVIAVLGFELAIPIAASEVELASLLAISGATLVATTGMLAVAVGLAPDAALNFLWLGQLASHRTLLPLGFACLGGYYIMLAVATRAGAFRDIAATRISQGLSGPISQIAFGLLGFGAPGLAIGFVIGQSSGTFLLFSRVVLQTPGLLAAISWRGIKATVQRYARFPLLASWARLLDMAGSGTILFVMFSACYSSDIAGFMFLTERVIARPLFIVSTSLLQVFVGEAGQAVQNDPARLRRRFRQVIPRQFLLASIWIALANLLAGWAFPILFGPKWDPAIPYLHAMSAGYLAVAVLHPVSTSLQIMERQVLAAVWQVGRLALVVASVVVPWRLGLPALSALWATSVTQVAACAVMLALIAFCVERIQPRGPTPG